MLSSEFYTLRQFDMKMVLRNCRLSIILILNSDKNSHNKNIIFEIPELLLVCQSEWSVSADWLCCSCLLWEGHIMDDSRTLFFIILHCTIFILLSWCWNTHSLIQRLSDIICWQCFLGSPSSQSRLHRLWQHISPPTQTRENHMNTLPPPHPHIQTRSFTNWCQRGQTFSPSRQPSGPVLTALCLSFT